MTLKKNIQIIRKKFVVYSICVSVLLLFSACSNESQEKAMPTNIDNTASSDTMPLADNDWLYQGYWFYPISGGYSTDIFVFKFIDEHSLNVTSYYDVEELKIYGEPEFISEKFLFSTDKKFGKYINTEWEFAFDNNKGKLYIKGMDDLYEETLHYNEITESNLKKALKTYQNKDLSVQIDDSEAKYDLNNICLDYTEGNENKNGNSIQNHHHTSLTKQEDYIYYIDDNYIKKIDSSYIPDDVAVIHPETLYSDEFGQQDIHYINVYKNYIYFSSWYNDVYEIYRIPTSYIKGFGKQKIAESISDDFYFDDGNLYYAAKKETSASSGIIVLNKICIDESMKTVEITEMGTDSSTEGVHYIGVNNGYAFWANTKIKQKMGGSEEKIDSYSRYNIKNNNTDIVKPNTDIGSCFYKISNEKVYCTATDVSLLLDRTFGGEKCTYYEINFEDKVTKEHSYDLSCTINCFYENGDFLITNGKNGTYLTDEELLKENKGLKITDDSIDHPYVFDNDIYYFEDDYLCYIDKQGENWCKVVGTTSIF